MPLSHKELVNLLATQKNAEDFTVDGKYSCCGECCGRHIPLSDADIKRIRSYISKNNIKPVCHAPAVFAVRPIDMYCPFLTLGHKCQIYSVRPAMCRFYLCKNDADPESRATAVEAAAAAHSRVTTEPMKKRDMWLTFFPDSH